MKSISAAQKIGAFLLALALFYLLGLAKAAPDMAPLSIGLYCALIYCRKNYFAVSIAFIGGVCAAGHDLISLIDACSAALVFGVALAIHFKAALPLKIAHAAIYAFLSMLPRFFLGLFLRGIVLQGVCFLVVNTVFCVCACIGLYAFFVRGTGTGLAYDETLGLLLLAAGLGLGAYQAELWGYRPFFTVLCALCCAGAYAFPPLAGAGICASFALGGATATGEAGILGAAVAIWAGGALFGGQGKWFCALACEGVYLLSGYVLHAFEYFDTLNICLASAGIAAVALIPSSLLKGLGKRLFPPAYSAALYAAERERRELFDKLGGSARLFLAMAQEFEKQAPEKPKVKSVCADVAVKVCSRCKEREKCLDLAGEQAFERAAERALEGKETDAEDLPLFIIGKCAGLDELLQAFSASARAAERAEKRRETAQENGRAIAAQMRGMAAVLGRLATSISRVGGGDERAARELISELGYVNVVCRAAAVTGSGQELKVTLRLREGDEEKKAVEKVVARLMKKKMALRECVRGEGTATLVFAPAPAYMLACGSAGCVKEGSSRAGDVSAVTDVGEGMVLASVCDGMGSGGEAAEESRACLDMLENFCRCGFEKGSVPALINKFLALRGGERFCALDACLIDLCEGTAEFVKLGAVESFLLREGTVKTIRGGALPVGVLDEITPVYEKLPLKDGDMLVMVSDGVLDALTLHGAEYALERIEALNPQKLANALIAAAKKCGVSDDASVLAVRILGREE